MAATLWKRLYNWSAGKGKDEDVALQFDEVSGAIEKYNALFKEDAKEQGRSQDKIQEREGAYAEMVKGYYALVTSMYESGWGQSFHFSTRFRGESFAAATARHEHFLALRMGLKPGMRVLDVGCGVGGPMRSIARFSGADVTGVTISDYQVGRANVLNRVHGLDQQCRAVQGDFMDLKFPAESFDCAYQIEATCHSPDKVATFKQILRQLKPGGVFVGYEWVMTPKYDPRNAEHNAIKHGIEKGDALPDLPPAKAVDDALAKAGFEVVKAYDMALDAEKSGCNRVSWYSTLQGGIKLSQIRHSKVGRFMTQSMIDVLETVRIAPKGTSAMHKMLCVAADALARGGETGIFTPMYFFMARKPLN